MAAGSIIIDLLMKTGAFETDTKRAEKALQNMQKTAKAVGAAIGTALAGAATVVGVWTKQTIEAAAQVDRLSTLANTSTSTFQEWAAGASMVGIEQDKLADILKDVQDKVGDFMQTGGGGMADFFEQVAPRVGVTAEQFRKLSGPDALQLYVDSLQKANLSQSDMVFYMEAIASDSSLLLPLLRDNGKAMGEYGDMAEKLGAVMSGDLLNAAEQARGELTKLDLIKQGLVNRIVAQVLPALTSMTEKLVDTATNTDALDKAARVAVTGMKLLTSAGIIVGGIFKTVGEALGGVAATVVQILQGQFSAAAQTFLDSRVDIVKNVAGTIDAVKAIWDDAEIKGTPLTDAAKHDTKLAPRVIKQSGKKVVDEAAKIYKQVEAELAKIKRDIDTFSMSDKDVQLYDLKAKGATPDQLKRADVDLSRLEALKDERDLTEKLNDEDERRLEHFLDTKQSIADEIDLLGMSRDQQEVWNNLKWAGVTAEDAWGKQIIASTEALQRQRDAMDDQIEAMDAVRSAGKDLFKDLVHGENPLDAMKKALDSIYDKILDIIAQNLMDSLFGKSGSPAGGMTGGFFSSIFGGLFGGGKAGGGNVLDDRTYLVGEDGPELFMPRTAGTIVPTQQTSELLGGGRRTLNQSVNVTISGRPDRRTPEQIARAAGRESSRAMARTGR